jgi:hypothetical protein
LEKLRMVALKVRVPTPGGGGVVGGVTLTIAIPITESCTVVAVTTIEVMEVTEGAVSMPALEIVPPDEDQFTILLKVPLPVTTTEQGSDAPEANGVAQVGTTEETVETGAGDFGACVGEVPPPQPPARIANSKAIFVLLIVKAFFIAESQLNLQRRILF